MVKSVSKIFLREARNTISRVKNSNYLKELMDRKNRAIVSPETSVFISFEPGDEEAMISVLLMLDSAGVKIYPVWSDPVITSGQRSNEFDSLRKNISRCSKFVFIASENALKSNRCNWELGIGDGLRYPDNIAVMPVTEQRGATWSCPDYLQTFPKLVTDNDFFIGEFFIESMEKKISLTDWLRQS